MADVSVAVARDSFESYDDPEANVATKAAGFAAPV